MGFALLKAKSSKILKKDGVMGEDESAEGICSLYVLNIQANILPSGFPSSMVAPTFRD